MPATYAIISVSKRGEQSDTKFGYTAEHSSEIVNAVAKSFQDQNVEELVFKLEFQARLYSSAEFKMVSRLTKALGIPNTKISQFSENVDLEPSSTLAEKMKILKIQLDNMPTE